MRRRQFATLGVAGAAFLAEEAAAPSNRQSCRGSGGCGGAIGRTSG